jgi:pimeloyl-ACP methyl ester carboxylesterase
MPPNLAPTWIPAVAIVVAACAGAGAHPSVAPDQRVAASAPATGTGPAAPVGLFEVGGRSLYVECAGSGSPAIVFLHGIGGNRSGGDFLLNAFSSRVRVCTYDRANQGASDPLAGRQTAANAVTDLHKLLAAAGVGPPYLLVAGSFGGLIGISYASTYPSEVVGMVMLDATLPADAEIDRLLPEPDRTQATKEFAVGREVFAYSTLAEAGAAVDKMPGIPVTYLGATQFAEVPTGWPADQINALTRQHWRDFVARFPRGRLVEVDSPHFPMPHDVIIGEVDRMLALLRKGDGGD